MKGVIFCFVIFLNSKTSVVTNLKPFNSVYISISLIEYSINLNCSSGLKELNISTL